MHLSALPASFRKGGAWSWAQPSEQQFSGMVIDARQENRLNPKSFYEILSTTPIC
jgi:hypothetical protein